MELIILWPLWKMRKCLKASRKWCHIQFLWLLFSEFSHCSSYCDFVWYCYSPPPPVPAYLIINEWWLLSTTSFFFVPVVWGSLIYTKQHFVLHRTHNNKYISKLHFKWAIVSKWNVKYGKSLKWRKRWNGWLKWDVATTGDIPLHRSPRNLNEITT